MATPTLDKIVKKRVMELAKSRECTPTSLLHAYGRQVHDSIIRESMEHMVDEWLKNPDNCAKMAITS